MGFYLSESTSAQSLLRWNVTSALYKETEADCGISSYMTNSLQLIKIVIAELCLLLPTWLNVGEAPQQTVCHGGCLSFLMRHTVCRSHVWGGAELYQLMHKHRARPRSLEILHSEQVYNNHHEYFLNTGEKWVRFLLISWSTASLSQNKNLTKIICCCPGMEFKPESKIFN